MNDCIFCKIVEGKIPSTRIYEDERVIGFKDLRPQAKIHQLFIHKNHTRDINDMALNESSQLVDLFQAIRLYTEDAGLCKEGFRVVTNQGHNAGQTVFHTHFHVLAGEPLGHFGS
jgi:histidine triad (HIT) family protein